jgi:hypothetical protein
VLPKAFFTALAAVGLGCALAGAALLTVLAPASEVGGEVTVDGILVTDPGVAPLTGGTLTVDVRAPGPVFAGTARQVDADAWVGSAPADRVTGLTADGRPDVSAAAGTEPVPQPRDSDVWTELAAGDGSVTLAVASPGASDSVVVVADAATVTLRWGRDADHPAAWPLLAGGVLVTLWGGAGLDRRNRRDRRRRPARRGAPARAPGTWALAAALTAAGCAAMPEPAPGAGGGPAAALTTGQAGRVLAAVAAAVRDGPAERRLTGPALDWHEAAAAGVPGAGQRALADLAGAVADADGRTSRWPLLVPRTDAWPRAFAVAVPSPATVAVLVADGPREPYRLWAALDVLDGRPMPPWPSAAEGAVPVGAGTGPPPELTADLPARVTDVLARGDDSEHAPEFAADPVTAASRARVAALADARGARVAVDHAPVEGAQGPVALALVDADGGALVAAAVATTVTVAARPGGEPVRLPDDVAAAAGVPTAREVRVGSTVALLFAVPAERGNIGPPAAADGITSVTAS